MFQSVHEQLQGHVQIRSLYFLLLAACVAFLPPLPPSLLADRIHHQDLTLPLGDLIQRQQRFVLRRQVERATDRRADRRGDGAPLHGAARPHRHTQETHVIRTYSYLVE